MSGNVGVGYVMEHPPVFIAAFEHRCLYYLTRVRACVDLRREKMRVRSQQVPLILGDDARGVTGDKPGHVTYEAGEEARCMRARSEHRASMPDHTMPVTSTAVAPREGPCCGVFEERRMAEEALPPI